jgi:hypothetical protein
MHINTDFLLNQLKTLEVPYFLLKTVEKMKIELRHDTRLVRAIPKICLACLYVE